jgi:hypothetical protein
MNTKLRTLFTSALVVAGLVTIPAVASASPGQSSASIAERGQAGGRGERGGRGFEHGRELEHRRFEHRFERGHWEHGRWVGPRWYVGGAYYDYDYCAAYPYATVCVW